MGVQGNKFEEYSDEKLRLFILTWEYCSQVRIINNMDTYQEALKEAEKRGLII